MLFAWLIRDARLGAVMPEALPEALGRAAWVDLLDADDEERAAVESLQPKALPGASDTQEIEASSRFYCDETGLHIHVYFLVERDGHPQITTVAFALRGEQLISLREHDIPAFRLLRMRSRSGFTVKGPADILLVLLETQVGGLADHLEYVHAGLEDSARQVLGKRRDNLDIGIDSLAEYEEWNSKVRLCLTDVQRGLRFLLREGRLSSESAARVKRVKEMLRDIDSLLHHSTFLFDRINFLMDAAQGFINIQQNRVIKIFSVTAVIFLPPTLVASSYGMNFEFMPELSWPFGYPMAIVMMVIAAMIPYWFFKRKGWL